jgi:hypothetical protein
MESLRELKSKPKEKEEAFDKYSIFRWLHMN